MPIIYPCTLSQREGIIERAKNNNNYDPRSYEPQSCIETLSPEEKFRAEIEIARRNSDPRLS